MSYKHYINVNHEQFDCLFNSMFMLETDRAPVTHITGPLLGESNGDHIVKDWPIALGLYHMTC